MIDHVTVRVSDWDATGPVYGALLRTLGLELGPPSPRDTGRWGYLSVQQADVDHPATTGLHLGLVAPSRAAVDAFHAAGLVAGWRDDGAPGPRPQYVADYYGGFLLDPDANSVEAVHHDAVRTTGVVDHLWLRTGDLAAVRKGFAAIAPVAGLTVGVDTADHLLLRAGGGSVSFVPGEEPTRGVHLAFSADDDAAVDAFHAAALAAGWRDDGTPGLRPRYHHGYYAAFVRGPDGTSVEVVHHRR